MARDLYEVGEDVPLGVVPPRMYASVIRPERYGEPVDAFRTEVVDVPPVGRGQVLVRMMAAGVNYNNVWSALGRPLDVIAARRRAGAPENFHIGGSEGSGVVWAVGKGVCGVRVGDPVVLSACKWDETAPDIRMGGEPMASRTQHVWGYEGNYGSFAQFTVVQDHQCFPIPAGISWEQAASFLLTAATAHRQLRGWPPHVVQPGDPVLIWGGAGGLGCMAIQLVRIFGGIPVAVTSSTAKAEFCMRLGAQGVIDRTEFGHWGSPPDVADADAYGDWLAGVQSFGRRIREIVGQRRDPRIVFEHIGKDTIPTSMYVCDRAGMVVICGGTTGYRADIDLRYLWMRQKRLQGSHFANPVDCQAVVHLMNAGRLDPCTSLVLPFEKTGEAHQALRDNTQPPGNVAVLINAAESGLTCEGNGARWPIGGRRPSDGRLAEHLDS